MRFLASNFFYKETGIYVMGAHFIPPTGDLNWVLNFRFHDTYSEHSVHLCSFTLSQYSHSWLNCHGFPHSVQDSTLLRAWVCNLVLCSLQQIIITHVSHTHTHTLMILHMCYCVEAYLSWGRAVKRHITWKRNVSTSK